MSGHAAGARMTRRRRAAAEHVDRAQAPLTEDDRRAQVGDVLSQVADDLDRVETHPTSICVIEVTPRGLVVRTTPDMAPLGAHVRGILERLDGAPVVVDVAATGESGRTS